MLTAPNPPASGRVATPGPASVAPEGAAPRRCGPLEWLLAAAFAAVAYHAAFRLPFRWPPARRVGSASYAFGFDNRVAVLAVAALVAGVAVYLAARRTRTGAVDLPLRVAVGDEGRGPARWALAAAVAGYAALTVALYAYTARLAPSLTWESRHFVHRLLLMDVYGLRPYTDFSSEYGPALTVTPLWVYRLLRPLGANHEQAYFASHLLLNVAGLGCLYFLLSRAAMPPRRRAVAFGLLAAAGFGPYMGLNGVLLRYLGPFASLLVGHTAVMRFGTRRPRPGGWAAVAGAVLVLSGANLLVSPEIGLAFALAWLTYAALLARRHRRVLAASLAGLAATALLARTALPPAYAETLVRFSQGANNLPLLPAPHLLLYLVTLLLAAPPLLAAGLRAAVPARAGAGAATAGTIVLADTSPARAGAADLPPDGAPGALCGALGAACVALAPGALGRADPPHVLFYGLGASALLLVALANRPRPAFALYAAAYGAVFVALAPVVLLVQFYGASPRSLLSRAGLAEVAGRVRAAGAAPADPALLAALDRYPRLGLPFATYGAPDVERHVITGGRLAPEYYPAAVGVYTDAALRRKLGDVAASGLLLVPSGYETRWSRDRCAQYLAELRRATLYPARLACRAAAPDYDQAVNGFIAGRYAPVAQFDGWVVLGRRAGPPSVK